MNGLRVVIERGIGTIPEAVHKARYEGDERELDHAQAFASRAEEQHLSMFSKESDVACADNLYLWL